MGNDAHGVPIGGCYTRRVIRRYLLPCVLIMAVAVGAAGLAYREARKTAFSATCTFQALVHVSQQSPQSADFLDFFNRLAANEVSIALTANPYVPVARDNHVNAGTLAANTLVQPVIGLGIYSVRVVANEGPQAVKLTNALCDQFVKDIRAHRTNEIDAQVADLQSRILALQTELKKLSKVPPAKRTLQQRATITARQEALGGNTAQMANILSLPPDNISTLVRAVGAQAYDPRHLAKDMLIGLVAGLLVCFLYVLGGEIISERRDQLATPDSTAARAEPANEPQGR